MLHKVKYVMQGGKWRTSRSYDILCILVILDHIMRIVVIFCKCCKEVVRKLVKWNMIVKAQAYKYADVMLGNELKSLVIHRNILEKLSLKNM